MSQQMKIKIVKQADYKSCKYCIVQFKGRFQLQGGEQQQSLNRQMMHLGDLQEIQPNKYRFEIGIMDLIGRGVDLKNRMYYVERVKEQNQVKLIVKGIIEKKILFDKRPVPDMQRAKYETKINPHLFAKNQSPVQINQA